MPGLTKWINGLNGLVFDQLQGKTAGIYTQIC